VVDGLHAFRAHMDGLVERLRTTPAPAKVRRYGRMYEAGLPLDITVRWYPASALEAIEARVEELTAQGRQMWISHAPPSDLTSDQRHSSIEKSTELPKGITSVEDFHSEAVATLQEWNRKYPGSWAKTYYDTPLRSLIGGILAIDTNRHDSMHRGDMRTLRLEAASGISDVRHLQRQMSARKVAVVYSDPEVFSQVKSVLDPPEEFVQGLSDPAKAFDTVRKMGPHEPLAVMIDCTAAPWEGFELAAALKNSKPTRQIPVVLILDTEAEVPLEVRTLVASLLAYPVSPEEVRTSILMTGFRLLGDATGFKLAFNDKSAQREVDRLLSAVMGVGGMYRRMMARIANLEGRPTIAFEFKLVPLAPYEFFFIDYEWSGVKNPLHRFDWLYSLGSG